MASLCEPSGSKPITRRTYASNLADFVGGGHYFLASEVPSYRSVMRTGILFQQLRGIRDGVNKRGNPVRDIARDLTPMVLARGEGAL